MQLVAYGAQDVYLSGNPQITFFKVVYRRHTNFSVEPIEQTWNGNAILGNQITCNINRNGDLITHMYVIVSLKAITNTDGNTIPWGYVNKLGHSLISDYKVDIGGSKIDEQYGDWLNIWYELSHKTGQENAYAQMIGDTPELKNISLTKPATVLYIPLQFWFNRNNGLALPLIALQYHEVRITVTFRDASVCVNYLGSVLPSNVTASLMTESILLIDYVYLDSEERKRFAQASHEYLIEQLQFSGSETFSGSTNKFRLQFNHPSKYLIWVSNLHQYISSKQYISYATDSSKWKIALDNFAIIIAAANAPGLGFDNTGYYCSTGTNFPPEDIIDLSKLYTNLTPIMNAELLSKFTVQFIAQPGSTNNHTVLAINASQLINNAFVTSNNLTIKDISVSITQLLTNNNTLITGIPAQLLNSFAISIIDYSNYGLYLDGRGNTCLTAKIQLNGHDRFTTRDGNYFNYVQPYQHFSNTPVDGINVYSFALKAEEHQPTGTCNFSRIDNATLFLTVDPNVLSDKKTLLNIYAVNYNVLRVMSGMGAIAYNN